jgi:hypothetical protein
MIENLEQYAVYAVVAGALLLAVGSIWLLVRAFRTNVWWGLLALLFFPIGAIVFAVHNWKRARWPVILAVVGGLVLAAPFAVNYYQQRYLDLGEREKIVDGELHLTLTRWDKKDYSFLRLKPQTVVLQMANADVTDQTLEYVRGMKGLHVLDVSDSQVTDAGLDVLAELPNLQVLYLSRTQVTDAGLAKLKGLPALRRLYLAGTKITEQGFKDHLATLPSLRFIDADQTAVPKSALRAWRNVNLAEREYNPK